MAAEGRRNYNGSGNSNGVGRGCRGSWTAKQRGYDKLQELLERQRQNPLPTTAPPRPFPDGFSQSVAVAVAVSA